MSSAITVLLILVLVVVLAIVTVQYVAQSAKGQPALSQLLTQCWAVTALASTASPGGTVH